MKHTFFAEQESLSNPTLIERQEGIGGAYARYAKRPLDISIVVMAMPFILPIVFFLALLVWIDGGRPFYTQQRLGRGGRSFRLFKLRTMVKDADAALARHLSSNPDAKAEWDETQKLKRDPRITPLGRFLRKSSLDELPQLLNVLIGDMSLVGPRPIMVSQAVIYPAADYLRLRPGVTGIWQVSDRNDASFAQRATYDAVYARQMGLSTDLRILARTASVVVRCTGY